ncbi:LysR family transcriptional regulator [Rhodovastum atsumiense]|uniref:LysR family transcriptional regulator n=1 Tax=Rhodovastum atsumiense TaxID=504468 RepID=A0A5M6IQX8_9PROT|nr:LysR family transcriptional regulator [Rhodovastum atsumiense]KAA5610309.1 LysR family transcriptional regulator [Rhodovastum atsumiense]CAH2602201.1 LysR family transcriptional regulator [Rhodovastum atsumiense]
MDRLAAMAAFLRVVERGSFTAAAEDLRLSRAMVSKHIQDLEQHLGARLLNRTTRKVSLTEAGRVYFERGTQVLADLAETEAAVGELQARPRGRLRINAPLSFGLLHLGDAVADYMAAEPEVTVELTLNDRVVDLVEEGYDVAVRIARLTDSSLIARRLAPCRLVVCAAPAYLARHGRPLHPHDLTGHDCLSYSYDPGRDDWRFDGPQGAVAVTVRGRLRTNNGDVLRSAALRGAGIARLPSFIVGPDLAAGRLVPLLCGYRVPELGIHAVYPHSRHLSAKVRSFVDFLAPRFGERPDWDGWMTLPQG